MKQRNIKPIRTWGCPCALFAIIALTGYWFLFHPFLKAKHYHSAYEKIEPGTSRAQVIARMGESWKELDFHVHHWDGRRLPEHVVEQAEFTIMYSVHTFYVPISFRFTFDKDGGLIAKQYYD